MNIDVRGKRVFAATGGKPFDNARPCVLLVHGSGLDHGFWDFHARFFASQHYAVLCPDLPGHSASEGPPIETIEEIGEWLHEVVETLDANDISVVGHSQGVLVALEFVSRYPERTRSVSLIASGLRIAVNPALIEAAENDPGQAIDMMSRWSFAADGPSGGEAPSGETPAAAIHEAMHRNARTLAADLRANDAYRNGTRAAAGIAQPVQVMVASQDRMISQSAIDELIAHLDRPRVDIFPDSGHMIPLEAADQCSELLLKFIREHNPVG